MTKTPWFNIGKDGPPRRSGLYEFELSLPSTSITLVADYVAWNSFIITDDARLIGLVFEDHWRGMLK